MANTGYEIDDEYADGEYDQHFIKIYFDFETEDECYDFAEWAEDNWWKFQAIIDEFEKEGA